MSSCVMARLRSITRSCSHRVGVGRAVPAAALLHRAYDRPCQFASPPRPRPPADCTFKRPPCPLPGCDSDHLDHWMVLMKRSYFIPEGREEDTYLMPEGVEPPSREEIVDKYVRFLVDNKVFGSEEEARMKIYSVSTKHYYGFGALIPDKFVLDRYGFGGWEGVFRALPDGYDDVDDERYPGEPFINGQLVPYHPKYHERWLQEPPISYYDYCHPYRDTFMTDPPYGVSS